MKPKLCSQEPLTGTLSWVICIQSTTYHPISLTSILILSFHFCLSLPSGIFHSHLRPKFYMHFSSLACYMSRPSHSAFLDHHNNIWWSVQDMRILIMQSSPASRMRNAYILVGKPKENSFEDRRWWDGIIKIRFAGIGCMSSDWIQVDEGGVQWRLLLLTR